MNEDLVFAQIEALMQDYKGALKEELMDAAFEVLQLHPGCDYDRWASLLCEQYGTEIVDVFGNNRDQINTGLSDLWCCAYKDGRTGMVYTFEEWSKRVSAL